MKREKVTFRRRGWLVAFIGLIVVGMGQIYNGEFLKGVSFFIIFAITFITGFRLSVFLPDRYLMVGLALTLFCLLCIYTFTIIEAYRKASDPLDAHQLRSYNKWYFYVAIWMILAIQGNWAISHYVRKNFIQFFKIPTKSMQPKVLKGDRVIADKTAYSRMDPQRGDIVVFIHPGYRSKIYIARIEALPGETQTQEDGRAITIPHGYVFVKKIKSGEGGPHDSSGFGPIPLRDVIGKVRQVLFSSDEQGIRWERMGKVI